MKRTEAKWDQNEWLGRCAWCRRRMDPDEEVIGVKVRFRPEAIGSVPPGTVQPLPLPGARRTVPMVIPALDSAAQKEGVDGMFQVCSDACGRALQDALAREMGLPVAPASPSSPAATGIPAVRREEAAAAWEALCSLEEPASEALARQFMEEQPALGIYLAAKNQELEEDNESPMIELAMCAWQCLGEAAGQQLPRATPDQIEAAEDANIAVIEGLEEASEIQYDDVVRQVIGGYRQRELLLFLLEVLMADDTENPELAPESIGLELLWIKTVIDCLDPRT